LYEFVFYRNKRFYIDIKTRLNFIRRAWTLRWWNGRRMDGSKDRSPE